MKTETSDSSKTPALGVVEGGAHLTLEALKEYVRRRQSEGAWEDFPAHLAECPACLEAYEILLAGEDMINPDTLCRMESLLGAKSRRLSVSWKGILLRAALFLVLLGAVLVWRNRETPNQAMSIASGSIVAVGQPKPFPAGCILPPRVELATRQSPAVLRVNDRSILTIAPETRFALPSKRFFASAIELIEGAIDFDVVHQEGLQRFRVSTPLGEIIVVGTKFRVTSLHELVTVYSNAVPDSIPSATPARLATVRVHVTEGRVLVRNRQEEAYVSAGTTALLRENQPMIDLTRD